MKMKIKIILLIILSLNYASEAQIKLETSTQSNAGGVTSSGDLVLTSAFGQPSPISVEFNNDVLLGSGFIYNAVSDPFYYPLFGEGIVCGAAQPNGNAQTAYRLISIPIIANNKSPNAVLADDLGSYDNTKWRFFELKSEQTYSEYPNTSDMICGKSFWLIIKDAGKVIDTGPGKTNTTVKPFLIHLDSGWTFIGNPFNYSVPLVNLSYKRQTTSPDIRYYNGSWNTLSSPMEPFEGYAIASFGRDTLIINPPLTMNAGIINKIKSVSNVTKELWSVHILAQCQEAKDNDNRATIVTSASKELDQMDKPEPPVIGEYVSVYFPHPEWKIIFKNYSADARPLPENGITWDFDVKSNIKDNVTLKFDGLNSVPEKFEVWLIDKLLKTTTNLKESNIYMFANADEANPRQMSLVVGTSDYVHNKLVENEMIPTKFELSQNFPNPFNPATIIRYGLPSASRVIIKLYDVLGQEIKTLVDETHDKGYQSVEWNGKNEFGLTVASGIYIYRITATNPQNINESFIQTKRMLLLK
jgi:hypothetical protein